MKGKFLILLVLTLTVSFLVLGTAQGTLRVGSRASAGQQVDLRQPQGSVPRSISYTYDGAGRLIAADYGDGLRIVYSYDNAGNLLWRSIMTQNLYLPTILKGK